MIGFGLPGGVLSVAWTSMSDKFGVAITSLGSVVAAYIVGYTIASFSSGWLLQKGSLGRFLTLSAALSGLGYVAFAAVPGWWLLLAVSVTAGAGHGFLDTGLNLFAATRLNGRITNWIHAFFGLGSLAGSSLMTGFLLVGLGWEWGYLVVAGPFVVLVVGFALTRKRWQVGRDSSTEVFEIAGMMETLRVPAVWVGIAAFALQTALEVAAGVWSFTLLTEKREISVATAGGWVSAFFGGLFFGRVMLGTFADRLSAPRLLRLSGVLSVVGALAFWQVQISELNLVGLILLGFGLGPIFPTLISATPSYVGARHTQNAIGLQIGASAVGGGLIPAGVGFVAAIVGLEAISVALVIGSSLMLGVLWTFEWLGSPSTAPARTG